MKQQNSRSEIATLMLAAQVMGEYSSEFVTMCRKKEQNELFDINFWWMIFFTWYYVLKSKYNIFWGNMDGPLQVVAGKWLIKEAGSLNLFTFDEWGAANAGLGDGVQLFNGLPPGPVTPQRRRGHHGRSSGWEQWTLHPGPALITDINIQISDSDSWGWENTNNTINTIIPAQLMGCSSFLI